MSPAAQITRRCVRYLLGHGHSLWRLGENPSWSGGAVAADKTGTDVVAGGIGVAEGGAAVAGRTAVEQEEEVPSGWSCRIGTYPCTRNPVTAMSTRVVAWCSSTARGPAATPRRSWERTRRLEHIWVGRILLVRRMTA